MSTVTAERYSDITLVEYIWLDVNGIPRSKSRVLPAHVDPLPENFPEWNFDGSSTGQAETLDSEVWLKPAAVYKDPFTPGHTFLLLCETYEPDGKVHPTNTRAQAQIIHNKIEEEHDPWFGIEQEFFLIDSDTGLPLGFPGSRLHCPRPQGSFYCGVGDINAIGRKLVIQAFLTCLEAKIKVCGMNGEVAPGQWEIQVGPLPGVAAADDIIMLRYILHRVSEGTGVTVEFGAKPVPNYNGSGAHTNFSTKAIRNSETGLAAITKALTALRLRHHHHLSLYQGLNNDNAMRLTGTHETSDPKVFSYGVGARDASVRIPSMVYEKGYGYLGIGDQARVVIHTWLFMVSWRPCALILHPSMLSNTLDVEKNELSNVLTP